jgi:hypothetical protein
MQISRNDIKKMLHRLSLAATRSFALSCRMSSCELAFPMLQSDEFPKRHWLISAALQE